MTSAMSQAFAAEAARVSKKTNLGAAMASSPNRQRIDDLRGAYHEALKKVRGDASLSELGRQQLIARIWTNTNAEIARLTEADFNTHVQRYNALEAQVFGTTANTPDLALSFRDACDRADKLDDATSAATALGNAELSGDSVLAKAIVLRAWQSKWSAVIDRYAMTHPTVTDQLAELGALRHHLDSQVSKLGGNMAGSRLVRPNEIMNLAPHEITEYAAAEPSPSLAAVQLARMRGEATPQDEEDARKRELGR